MSRRLVHCWGAAFLSATLSLAPSVGACPLCDSGTGEQVRAGIAEDGLSAGVLATLLPFALTAGVVAVVHFGGGGGRARRAGDGDPR